MYMRKGIRGPHESQAIGGSTWKSSKQSIIDKVNTPAMPIIPEKFLYSRERVKRLQFLEYLLRFGVVCNANPNYLLSGEVKPFNIGNMKPFIKGPVNNPLEVERK
jgi:hypothetical protein